MGRMQRTKGASGERELADVLFGELGLKFRRNLKQYQQNGEGDLECEGYDFPFLIECKRYATGWTCRSEWEKQAKEAAKKASKHPCVAYRFDRKEWRFRVYLEALGEMVGAQMPTGVWVDTDAAGFGAIARELMNNEQ